jgi:phthalate 4,5-cis-dihydrodiol dehydrogenase
VIVEKPMAISLAEAERMIEAAEKNGVKLLAGHTNSFELPIRAMRKVIQSGELGDLRAVHIWSYSDWMLRARTADESDPDQGGGIPYRQGSHQGDVVRLLGGGMLRSVRAMTGQWMPERTMPGYHCAYLEFEDGTPATIIHNGYGYFMTAELFPWAMENQRYTPEERVSIRQALRNGTRDDEADKQVFRIGGERQATRGNPGDPQPWTPADLGIVMVSCSRGDIRNSKYGLYLYGDAGQREITLRRPGEDLTEHRGELEELYNAVVLNKPVYHSGQWGMATLEVVMAILQSARERKEIRLTRQIPMPEDYDDDLRIE